MIDRSVTTPPSARWPERVLLVVAFIVAHTFVVLVGNAFHYSPEGVATCWPANGLLLAVLVRSGARWWLVFSLCSILNQALADMLLPLLPAEFGRVPGTWHATASVANVVEALIGAGSLRLLYGRSLRISTIKGVIVGTLLAVVLAPALAALAGAYAVVLATPGQSFWFTWQVWWFGDALGTIAVTPLVLAWSAPWERAEAHGVRGAIEGCVLLATILVVAQVVFGAPTGPARSLIESPYLVLPPLIWLTLRFEFRVTATALTLLTFAIVWHTDRGRGPFASTGETFRENVLALQLFLVTTSLTMLLLAATVTERRRAMTRLREEVAERIRAERRQRLTMDELDHRVKNNLASVLSLAHLSSESSGGSLPAFLTAFSNRIHALARIHERLAASRWEGLDVREIVATVLEPFLPSPARRLVLEGGPAPIPARACGPLTMSLHELATNAARHGALEAQEGEVRVRWKVGEDGAIEIVWSESGGRPVDPAPAENAGLRLVRGLVEYELRGTFAIDFAPGGVVCRITIRPNELAT